MTEEQMAEMNRRVFAQFAVQQQKEAEEKARQEREKAYQAEADRVRQEAEAAR